MMDPNFEASQVLAAALEQMDGIIAGHKSESPSESPIKEILFHLQKLTIAIDTVPQWDRNENSPLLQHINLDSIESVYNWLKHFSTLENIGEREDSFDDLQERLKCLEKDKDNLLLQVSVLTSQIEVQNEKIEEMEKDCNERKNRLKQAEHSLRKEMLTRSTLESSKLDLMSEVSSLRMRLTTTMKDSETTCGRLENELKLVQARLIEKDIELAALRERLVKNGSIQPEPPSLELELLKKGLDNLMMANKEKDKKIEDLSRMVLQYRKLFEPGTPRKDLSARACSEDCLFPQSPSGDHMKLFDGEAKLTEKPPPVPRLVSSPPSWTTSPSMHRASSVENVLPKASPLSKRNYVTIPRQHGSNYLQNIKEHYPSTPTSPTSEPSSPVNYATLPSSTPSTPKHNSTEPFRKNKSSGVSFGKGFFRLRKGKRCTSAPELAQPESLEVTDTPRPAFYISNTMSRVEQKDKNKGIKKIFEKLKRSGSTSLGPSEAAQFKRGGVRSTTGPRPGSNRNVKLNPELPFANWNTELVCDWLYRQGLGMYVPNAQLWLKSGQQLLNATPSSLEKELYMKNVLHKKKVLLAMQAMSNKLEYCPSGAIKLDNPWVIRWLDDIGLPQYKDIFSEARIDGLVLHFMTVDDLYNNLKIINHLHHLSLKRGIHVLRHLNFEPQQLRRRSQPEEDKNYGPNEVILWTNHRVMEWLRTVDLAEYAPNLRGSGVHGALMVVEPRFTADLLATLLNIPPNKTLLRRHLTTQFKHLVGRKLMSAKREWEAQPNFMPLSPSAKIKPTKKSQFTLKRKRSKTDVEFEDFLCPLSLCKVEVEDQMNEEMSKSLISSNMEEDSHSSSLSVGSSV